MKHQWVDDFCMVCGTPRDRIGSRTYVYGHPDGTISRKPPICHPDLRRQKQERLQGEFIEAVAVSRKRSRD